MKINLTHIIAAGVLMLAWLAGCNVHEFPDAPAPPQPDNRGEITLHLDFSTEMPPFKEIIYEPSAPDGRHEDGRGTAGYDIRHIVRFFTANSDSRVPLFEYIFTSDNDNLDYTAKINVAPGNYRIMVWSDYVTPGSKADRHYSTSDFASIALQGSTHSGNDDSRDAFRGFADASVAPQGQHYIDVTMVRPMAKFKFIATDFDIFLSRAESRNQPKGTPPAPAFRADDYTLRFRYTGFMPSRFNMFTDRPGDASTGVHFFSELRPLSSSEAEMGFDYVMVNGKESTVSVAVDVFDRDGQLIASTDPIDVPLKRSMLTTVRGRFLTSSASPGVGVDPGFTDDFNIFIP
ncbi:MAG: hypothetical protein NC241_06900 [Bacteroides sp.]|nr:hypothetical protein [Bacteroides sp.]MCM1457524.1 hypothetical protein [Lachnoclostridium sp.]